MEYIREHFDEIASTNDYAKSLRSEKKNRIITAKKQTGGRGTKGRSFSSNEGGVYLTKLDFYEDFPASRAFEIMANAASAVCDTLAGFSLSPQIKWANDVFVNGKKICGILVENVFSGNRVVSSVVGVGLNVYNELPFELSEIATNILAETGEKISVEAVTERLIAEWQKPRGMAEYLRYIGFMGEEATLVLADGEKHGRLLSVDEQGGLHVCIDGVNQRLTSAEVSLRARR